MNKGYLAAGIVFLVIGLVLIFGLQGGATLFTIDSSPPTIITAYMFIGLIFVLIGVFALIGGLIAVDPEKKKWQVQSGSTLYRIQEVTRACPVCRTQMQYTSKLGGWYCPNCKQYQKPME